MPAKSAAQQKAAGAALSAKRGKTSPSKLKGASRSMYKSMSERQLDEFASTKRKGKPEHAAKSRSKSASPAPRRGSRRAQEVDGAQIIVTAQVVAIATASAPAHCRLRRQRR
jgi:hypothetical protein